jgi:predicted transcriptional regulator
MEKRKKSELIAFRSESDIKEALEIEAAEKDRTVSWLINHHLRQALEQSGYIQRKSSEK